MDYFSLGKNSGWLAERDDVVWLNLFVFVGYLIAGFKPLILLLTIGMLNVNMTTS